MRHIPKSGPPPRRASKAVRSGPLAAIMLLIAGLMLAPVASANDLVIPIDLPQPNFVGLGIGSYPDYFGSKDSAIGAAPLVMLRLGGERYVELLANQVRINLIDDRNWRLGPSVIYHFGRDDDIEDPVVRKLHEIEDSIDVGFFGGYTWRDTGNDRKRLGFSAWTTTDVTGGHDGWTAGANVFGMYPVALPVTIAGGAGFTYGDGNYMDTYFGVTPDDSLASGLAPFSPGAGVRDARGWVVAMLHLSPQWHLGVGALYSRLLNDAKDSPIVSERGSADQWVYGIGAMYAW